MPDIRDYMASAIERTQDPTAPLKLQEAHKYVELVGKMMAGVADKDTTLEMLDNLTVSFPKNMDKIAADPAYICALCNLLSNALVYWAKDIPAKA